MVAQIYGVGLITSRITGVAFEVGVFLGLGGILVCSFLGGMRAVTWTQVAQYIVLLVAFLVPVAWLSIKQHATPLPQATYGYQLQKVIAAEKRLQADPAERQVIAIFQARAPTSTTRAWPTSPSALAAERGAAARPHRRAEGRQRAAGRHPGRRARARARAARRGRRARRSGRARATPTSSARARWPACRRMRSSSRAIRTATPRRARRSTTRAATSSRWCSA